MSDLPPDWALDRAKILVGEESFKTEGARIKISFHAFARYIASKEEAPVEPLVLEAREIAAQYFEEQGADSVAEEHREGLYDKNDEAQELALRALRRGIEIGKEQS